MKIPNRVKSLLVRKAGLSANKVQAGSIKVENTLNQKIQQVKRGKEEKRRQENLEDDSEQY